MGWIASIFLFAGLAAVIGIAIGLAIMIPTTIYIFPYLTWLGWNSGTKGIPKKHESDNIPAWQAMKLNVKNATKLYRSWVKKQPHGITKF